MTPNSTRTPPASDVQPWCKKTATQHSKPPQRNPTQNGALEARGHATALPSTLPQDNITCGRWCGRQSTGPMRQHPPQRLSKISAMWRLAVAAEFAASAAAPVLRQHPPQRLSKISAMWRLAVAAEFAASAAAPVLRQHPPQRLSKISAYDAAPVFLLLRHVLRHVMRHLACPLGVRGAPKILGGGFWRLGGLRCVSHTWCVTQERYGRVSTFGR